MNPSEAAINHKKHCGCNLQWIDYIGKRALQCQRSKALIWWPTVELDGLSEKKKLALICHLPMQYNSDGDSANEILLELGYDKVDQNNYRNAYRSLREALERDLRKVNIDKQLLGLLLGGDLE